MKTNILLIAVVVILGQGCSNTVGIKQVSEERWFEDMHTTALNSKKLSYLTTNYLQRNGLYSKYTKDPLSVIQELNDQLLLSKKSDTLFALIELSFGEAKKKPNHPDSVSLYLSSVIYAYTFLFDQQVENNPGPFEPQIRWTCEMYNRSLAKVIQHVQKQKLYQYNPINIDSFPGSVSIDIEEVRNQISKHNLMDVYSYGVVGFQRINRTFGLGVPYIAIKDFNEFNDSDISSIYLPKYQLGVPNTGILSFSSSIFDKSQNGIHAKFNLYDTFNIDRISINERLVPLEIDFTTPLAHTIQLMPEINPMQGLLRGEKWEERKGLYTLQPYQADKIPIVFVHGLMSNPKTWLPLFNDIISDPILREKYQFWFFMYPTGNPILYSASFLRESLLEIQQQYDPELSNSQFNQMIIVGHSMGGIITKTMVLRSGNQIRDEFFDRPIDQLEIGENDKEFLSSMFHFEPLPFVKRVVFLATPHRGSATASGIIGNFGSALINLPRNIVSVPGRILTEVDKESVLAPIELIEQPTSIRGLSPSNPVLKVLDKIPIESYVKFHSIIGDRKGTFLPDGNDGVVSYESSKLQDADSELLIHSDHNVHKMPLAIVEVKRIMYEHLDDLPPLSESRF